MIKHIKSFFIVAILLAIVLTACGKKGDNTKIAGVVKSGSDMMLYLEKREMTGVILVDSLKLDKQGHFSFSVEPTSSPELYQLRVGGQSIVLALDSAVSLNVEADALNLFDSYTVDNSEVNANIKRLLVKRNDTAVKIKTILDRHKRGDIDDQTFVSETSGAVDDYKELATSIILENMESLASYFAIFLKIDNLLIFNPYDKSDYRIFAAVATAWNSYYPNSDRTTHLESFALNARRVIREEKDRENFLNNIELKENVMPDIVLSDIYGKKRSLASLAGNVVLLDFTVYQSEGLVQRNEYLNMLHDKYSGKGFEIFQVSLDTNNHFWKTCAKDLPWVTVNDPASTNSHLVKTYNLEALPTTFLIDRRGQLSIRLSEDSDPEDEIKKLL